MLGEIASGRFVKRTATGRAEIAAPLPMSFGTRVHVGVVLVAPRVPFAFVRVRGESRLCRRRVRVDRP